ncbi:MAG: ATP-binding protein [Myxococcota bacterium]
MASPYRDGRRSAPLETTDDGIVDDLVRQFADPYAFFRELVQNGIDAGASELRAQVLFEEDGSFQASLRDDGTGMSREVVEGELLVLFKSGKEGREDAIGKFGIGFISVFALGPERVVVRTARGDGPRLTLHLHPDHTFELFESAGGRQAGTTVTVEVGPGHDASEVAVKAEASLRRWCRHAQVPLYLRVAGPGTLEREVRIDAPLALERMHASVAVKAGKTRAVLGLPKAAEDRYAGFFNAGLMLHESHEGAGAFRGLAFKVQDPRLEHTLSRDDVRRDQAYRRALDVVGRGVERLRRALLRELESAARSDHPRRYDALLSRMLDEAPALQLHLGAVPLVLLERLERQKLTTLQQAERFVLARKRSALTAALAAEGWAVLDAQRNDARMLNAIVEREGELPDANADFTLATPAPPQPQDEALLALLGERLDDAWRRPLRPRLVTLSGEHRGRVAVGFPGEARVVRGETPNPFSLLRRAPLALNVGHRLVEDARRRFPAEPELVAAMLARAVLLDVDALDAGRDARLTAGALDALLGAAS